MKLPGEKRKDLVGTSALLDSRISKDLLRTTWPKYPIKTTIDVAIVSSPILLFSSAPAPSSYLSLRATMFLFPLWLS